MTDERVRMTTEVEEGERPRSLLASVLLSVVAARLRESRRIKLESQYEHKQRGGWICGIRGAGWTLLLMFSFTTGKMMRNVFFITYTVLLDPFPFSSLLFPVFFPRVCCPCYFLPDFFFIFSPSCLPSFLFYEFFFPLR